MSALTKKHHTDLIIRYDSEIHSFKDVPKYKLKPIIQSLEDYEEDSIPWREVFKEDFEKAGGEIPYMIKAHRHGKSMTQKQLAKLLNMPQGNLSQIENGKRTVGKKLAKKLGKIFNVGYRVFL